ncbi:hypothetical protein [Paenibacillus woosongensis]|nr:hypothetical protein [Paenibacillus woosongensis]
MISKTSRRIVHHFVSDNYLLLLITSGRQTVILNLQTPRPSNVTEQ